MLVCGQSTRYLQAVQLIRCVVRALTSLLIPSNQAIAQALAAEVTVSYGQPMQTAVLMVKQANLEPAPTVATVADAAPSTKDDPALLRGRSAGKSSDIFASECAAAHTDNQIVIARGQHVQLLQSMIVVMACTELLFVMHMVALWIPDLW